MRSLRKAPCAAVWRKLSPPYSTSGRIRRPPTSRRGPSGLAVGIAAVCAIPAIAALAVPVSVTVWVVEGACIVPAAPFGLAGASAANDADERITVVGIAAERICADGAEGQSARNEKSGQSTFDRLTHDIFPRCVDARARAGTGRRSEHNTPGASAVRWDHVTLGCRTVT